MTTGMDLKLLRVAARVKTGELAAAMGVSDSRISHLESRAVVTVEAEERYRAALATLTTNPSRLEELEATA